MLLVLKKKDNKTLIEVLIGICLIVICASFFMKPSEEKSVTSVDKNLSWSIKLLKNPPALIKEQVDQGKEVLTYEGNTYVLFKPNRGDFINVNQVRQEGDRIVVYANYFQEPADHDTMPFLIQIQQTTLPVVFKWTVVQSDFPYIQKLISKYNEIGHLLHNK